jgi:N-acylneuraminate cytidylyltransferase
MKDIVAIIPARSGSKAIKDKNIKLINGIPLIAYSIAVAKKSMLIDRVIVSTDSEDYAEIASKYGAEVPFLRPPEISGDESKDNQFFMHAIDWFEKNELYLPKFFAHLRPTTPFRDFEVIDKAIEGFIQSKFSALRSCHKMSESSYKTFEIQDNKLKCLFDKGFDIESANDSRQMYPSTYNANGYIDIIRTSTLKSKGLMHGDCVQAFVTDVAYELDEPSDFELLEYLISKRPEYLNSLFS